MRNVIETRPGASVALNLYQRALAGGAQALGRDAGGIAPGRIADLVVLDTEHPALIGRGGDGVLDAWLFSGNSTPVRDVMVAGTWVVRDGTHRAQQTIAAAFAGLCEGWPKHSEDCGESNPILGSVLRAP